jgi:hypothetical protein
VFGENSEKSFVKNPTRAFCDKVEILLTREKIFFLHDTIYSGIGWTQRGWRALSEIYIYMYNDYVSVTTVDHILASRFAFSLIYTYTSVKEFASTGISRFTCV